MHMHARTLWGPFAANIGGETAALISKLFCIYILIIIIFAIRATPKKTLYILYFL